MGREVRWLIRACFFVSGCTSLVLELAWTKELSYILGNTLLAVSTVVAAFMAGLGVGSAWISRLGARIARPVRAYGVMELAIALAGAASIPVFRATTPLFQWVYRSFDPGQGPFLLVRFLVVFVLLFAPVVLMGATLPVVVGAVARSERRDSREAGFLYGANTLGAVAGTIVASFALLPALGIFRTSLVAAGLDVIIALVALGLDRRPGVRPETEVATAGRPGWSGAQRAVAILFGVSGAVAITYEVAWFRILGLTLGPSVYAFASMLAIYLLGVGLGSALAAGWAERTRWGGVGAMCLLEGVLGLVGLSELFYLNSLPAIHASLYPPLFSAFGVAGLPLSHLALAATLVLAPCLVMGALFPVAVRAIREAGSDLGPETNVGRLYLGNTAGGIAGSLLAGFLLIPRWGAWNTLIAGGLVSVSLGLALAALAARGGRPRGARDRRLLALLGAAAAAVVLAILAPPWNASRFHQGSYRDLYAGRVDQGADAGQLLYHREGTNAPVAVFRLLGSAAIYVGGKPDASTNAGDILTQSLLGHLPVLVAERPREVAVIGYGSGMTVGAVLAHPEVERVDVLEIERGVIDASPYFSSINGDPLEDPRAHLILEDGRIHLTYAPSTYDVITSEPSNPWMAGVANLFTAQFYGVVRQRLRPGGIFAQWIENYGLSEEAFAAILASLHQAFDHLLVFQSNPFDLIVLASDRPIQVGWEEIERRFAADPVKRSLARANIHDPLELGFFLLGPEGEALGIADRSPYRNTDDNTWLEHRAPFEMLRPGASRERPESDRSEASRSSRETPRAGQELLRRGASARLRALADLAPGVPLERAAHAIVAYPYRWEPGLMPPFGFSDPWSRIHEVQIPGMIDELRASRERWSFAPVLADSVAKWSAAGTEYRRRRAQVARRLETEGPDPDAIRQALALAPDLPFANLLDGALLLSQGDTTGARAAFDRVLAHPESGSVYFALLGLAQLSLKAGQAQQAVQWSLAAARRNPYYSNAFAFAAEQLLAAGDRATARSVLTEGLRFNPHHQDLERLLARAEGS